jgi:hypothetical protein
MPVFHCVLTIRHHTVSYQSVELLWVDKALLSHNYRRLAQIVTNKEGFTNYFLCAFYWLHIYIILA